jgi:hypothetical protein
MAMSDRTKVLAWGLALAGAGLVTLLVYLS